LSGGDEMKKLYVTIKEEETSEAGRFCGFTTQCGEKGLVLYFGNDKSGMDRFHAIIANEDFPDSPNTSIGSFDCDFASIEDFVNNHDRRLKGLASTVKEIYFFDSLKELFAWLAED
jgi:hypothetical protein